MEENNILVDDSGIIVDDNTINESEVVNETSSSIVNVPENSTEKESTENESAEKINNTFGNKFFTLKKEIKEVEKKVDEAKIAEVIYVKPKDLFVNYNSEFHVNQKSIIKRIREMKMLPKTRVGFVISIILISVVGVSILMKIDPKNHSIENYKANVLSIIGKKDKVLIDNVGVIDPNAGVIDPNAGVIDPNAGVIDPNAGVVDPNAGVVNENNDSIIKEKWLTITPEIVTNEDSSIGYIYKGTTYSKEELQKVIKNEVKEEISKKTKDYLNKMYINK